MECNTEFVNVAIRIKPTDNITNQCLRVISQDPPVLFLADRSQTFTFDKIFTDEVSQESVFNQTVKPLVQYVKQGYNCTIFAYGQTGTGKTYTMGTNPNVPNEEDAGLIPRTLKHFFEYNDISETEISVSFIEIYNEKVFDLLTNDSKSLPVKGLKALGFNQEKVFNSYEAKHLLKMGNKNRHTAGTNQNAQSSRSHAVFTIYCNVRYKNVETSAKLNLVDLAGSESVKKTGSYGSTFQEGININRGLLAIGQVMSALSNNANYIPYRESIVTSILQDSLNKNNFVSLIACVSPLSEDSTETVQTLEFGQRVKRIKSKPEVNEIISQFKRDNPILFPLKPNTPFKKPLIIHTPIPTKKKIMSIIPETNFSSVSPKSFSSSAASSISSTVRSSVDSDITQQSLSPVIRKYMNAMESSLMDKLGLVIKSTLKRPSREFIFDNSSQRGKENVATPHWSLLQNEVSKLVKSEIAQLTSTARATSSPIGEQLDDVRKVLQYDDSPDNNFDNKTFKTASVPTKNTKKGKQSLALSPIENILPRRSVRLSMKRVSRYNTAKGYNKENEYTFQNSQADKNVNFSSVVRRSVRLSMKQTNRQTINRNVSSIRDIEFSVESSFMVKEGIRQLQETLKANQIDSGDYFECSGNSVVSIENNKTIQSESVRRNAKRIVNERKNILTVLETPAGKRLLKGIQKDSPRTSHTKEVLNIINNGTAKQLEKLQTIGPKGALQLTVFRNINGKLNKLSDLKNVPGWSSKKFDKFVEQNFLKMN